VGDLNNPHISFFMNDKKLFQMALNLSDLPWKVTSIDFDQAEGRIDIHIYFRSGSFGQVNYH